ncbi:MAG: hypothetical protein ABSC63_04190 [Candidatus Binataceae bacterium]
MNQHIRSALPGQAGSDPPWPVPALSFAQRVLLISETAVTVFAAFWLHAFSIVPNHDNAWFLLATERLIAGGHIYYDVFDPNVPLIYILLSPSAAFSTLTGLDTYVVFSVWVCLLILWSIAQVSRSLLNLFGARRVAGAIAVLAYTVLLCFLPGYQFGQREHLAMILLCPWLFRFALKENGDSELPGFSSVSSAAIAAVGFLIKPYFVLLPIGMLIARGIEQQSWRIFFGRDAIIFSIISILYLGTVVLVFPQWFAVARLAVDTYKFLNQPMIVVLAAFWPPLGLVLAASVVWELAQIDETVRSFLRYLALAAILLSICSVAQHKGWDYHNIPALILMSMILVLLALAIWPSLARMHQVPRIAAAVLVMALLFQGVIVTLPMWFTSSLRTRSNFMAQPFPRTAAELATGRSFLAIAAWGFDVVLPTVSLINAQWSSRTAAQWMVPVIVGLSLGKLAERKRAEEIRQLWTRQVEEDLERYRPAVVAVRTADDRYAFELRRSFDILQLLLRDEGFRRAWAPYHQARVIKDWVFYTRSAGG